MSPSVMKTKGLETPTAKVKLYAPAEETGPHSSRGTDGRKSLA